jgi:hypothetical protein
MPSETRELAMQYLPVGSLTIQHNLSPWGGGGEEELI